MSPTLANFAFEAANFLLLAGALGWLLFRPIRRALAAERDQHAAQEQRTLELRAEAEALTERADTAQQRLTQELEQQRVERLAAIEHEVAQRLAQARAREQERRVGQQQQAEARHHDAMTRLADTLGQVAARSVEHLLRALDGPSLDQALVRAACQAIAAWPTDMRQPATVESARPLDPESRRWLHEALGAEAEPRLVPELGAGVRVTTPAGQVDGTALGLARQARREVTAVATEPPPTTTASTIAAAETAATETTATSRPESATTATTTAAATPAPASGGRHA